MKNRLLIRFKKITSYVIALSMIALSFPLIPAAQAVGTHTVTIGSQAASNGSSINVPISASNFANTVAGMDFTVQYDPTLLAYTGLTQNAISGHGTLTTGTSTNTVIMNWFDSVALSLDSGAIVTLNFTVISASTTNANLIFSGTPGLSDAIGDPISPASFVNGVISLNPASNIATVTSGAYTVSSGGTSSETITGVPYGTSKATFLATLTKSEINQTWNSTGISDPVVTGNTLVVTAQDGSTTVTYTVTAALNSAKAITAFTIANQIGETTINESAHTITVNMPYGTNPAALVASFTTTGSSVAIGTTTQASGVTANNFTSPVTYIVTAANSTTQNYVVTVNVAANPAKAITAFSFASPPATGVIDENAKTIAITVPFGTSKTALVASFTTTGYSVKVGTTTQTTGVTANNFTNPVTYTVTAADATTQTYVVTVTVAANTAKAITAFDLTSPATTGVINEGAHTISLTVPYETDVTTLVPTITITGESISPASGVSSNFTSPVTYTVTAADSSTQAYVVTVNFAAPSTIATVTSETYTVNNASSTIIGISYATASSTFLAAITKGESHQTWNISGLANPVVTGNTLVVTAQDGTTVKTYTLTAALNPAKDITSFSFSEGAGTITGTNIAVGVPFGTVVSALVPTIVLSGGTVSPLSGVAQDFANPVTYTVTAADSSTKVYTVTVTIAPDPIETAFNAISSTLRSSSGIVNNLNTVTSYNYTNFSGLYFEKRTDVTASTTAIGSITFNSSLDLSNDETKTFLQNLGTKMDANTTGMISLDFTGETASTTLKGASATIKFYGLNNLGFNASSTADEINSKLVAFEDDGVTPIDISTLVPSPGTYLGACEVGGGCYVFTVGVNHFTGYQIDNTAPTNQNAVFASSVSKKGGTAVTIVSSGDVTNNIWFAPSGTSVFVASATTTKAVNGTSTSILAPATEGTYKLYVVDSVGNVSVASNVTLTVDDTAPTIVIGAPSIASTNSGPITYTITYGGADTVTLANGNITLNTTDTATGTISVTGTGTTTRTVTISGITGNGTLGISVAAATASDSAGNTALAAGPSTTFIVDNIAPTVTKIGDDSIDVTIASSMDDILTFSETLSTAGKTAVQNALTIGADKAITYSWDASSTILTITGHATDLTTFANDVMANVTDVAGNSAILRLIDSDLDGDQIAPDESGDVTVSTTTPEVVITNPTQAVDVTIGSEIEHPTINVSSFIGSNGTGTLPAINITSANANNTTVAIPASTTVTSADATWDGVITAPTVTTVVIPATSGQTKTFSTAIQVGFTGAKLSFDNAVKILLPGQADKRAGYIRDGIAFTEITTTCGENSQTWANANLGTDGDCKINSGSDLVIWTKHFTSFATYTQTTNNTGGGGGGGAPAASCTSVVYGDWGSCFSGVQYRNILSQTPLGCSITTNQRVEASRSCLLTNDPAGQNVGAQASSTETIRVTAEEKELTSRIDSKLIKRLAGRILLQVERFGQAWYLDAISLSRFYLADGQSAYSALRKFGLGIKNVDLNKIPVALDSALPSNYSTSTISVSSSLVNRLKGRIVIQVENHGEAWYINPTNGQRYYLANGEAAYQIMRNLSLGISDINIRKITVGSWE